MLTSDGGVSSAWQSLLGVLTLIQGGGGKKFWVETERFRCAEGNQALATRLADAVLKEKSQILFNAEIKQVQVDDRVATVTLADGTKLEGSDVVLTAPPSTWNRIRFLPQIPATLMPQMGTNVKFLSAPAGTRLDEIKSNSQRAVRRPGQHELGLDEHATRKSGYLHGWFLGGQARPTFAATGPKMSDRQTTAKCSSAGIPGSERRY